MEAHPDLEIEVEGVLEKLPDGFGFLRSANLIMFQGRMIFMFLLHKFGDLI